MNIDKEDIEWAISMLVTIGCTWYSARKSEGKTDRDEQKKAPRKAKESKKTHQRRKRK